MGNWDLTTPVLQTGMTGLKQIFSPFACYVSFLALVQTKLNYSKCRVNCICSSTGRMTLHLLNGWPQGKM